MATIKIDWVKSEPISIRESANACGFNLATIGLLKLPDEKRKWIEKEILSRILRELAGVWAKTSAFHEITRGIYVVSLSDQICVRYPQGESQVLYVGRGKISNRIKAHLTNWITNFSESLQDVRLTFWMAEIKVKGLRDAFIEVESDLLYEFQVKYGKLPIANKNSGKRHEKYHKYSRNWTLPFRKRPSLTCGWTISPMPGHCWFTGPED